MESSLTRGKAVPHQAWGEPEVLRCNTSSSQSKGSFSEIPPEAFVANRKSAPAYLQEHVTTNVFQKSQTSGSLCRTSSYTNKAELPILGEGDYRGERKEEPANPSSPRQPTDLLSRGSALHGTGVCRPCFYTNTKDGCWHGADCEFCHLPHPKASRRRPSKRTRARCREALTILDQGLAEPEQLKVLQWQMETEGRYMEKLLRNRQEKMQAQMEQFSLQADENPDAAASAEQARGQVGESGASSTLENSERRYCGQGGYYSSQGLQLMVLQRQMEMERRYMEKLRRDRQKKMQAQMEKISFQADENPDAAASTEQAREQVGRSGASSTLENSERRYCGQGGYYSSQGSQGYKKATR